MLKNILNLEGTQKLSDKEQKSITGAGSRIELCPSDDVIVSCVFPKKCTLGANGWYCAY